MNLDILLKEAKWIGKSAHPNLWIGLDLDGTVFDKNQNLIDGAKEAVNKLYDAKNRISICTARGYVALEHKISLEDEKTKIEELLDKKGIKYSEVYFGVKPPCDVWIDDRTIAKEPQITWQEIANRLIPLKDLVFVMLTGLPGSGKSTLLKKRFGKNYVCLSRDAIVGMFQTGNTDESKPIAKRMEFEGIKAAFENGKSVALDKLNLSKNSRAALTKLAKKYNATVAVFYVNADPKDAWRQNLEREPGKKLTRDKFDKLVKSYEVPTKDEGFDYLIELNKENRDKYEEGVSKIIDVENKKGLVEGLKADLAAI